jgi:hypothetical protein
MKNFSDTIGNRGGDLRTFRAVPQPTAPPRTPWFLYMVGNFLVSQATLRFQSKILLRGFDRLEFSIKLENYLLILG